MMHVGHRASDEIAQLNAEIERLRGHVKTLRDVLEALAPDLHGYESDIAGEALIETFDASQTRVE